MIKFTKRQKGSALVEAMISLLIISLGVVSMSVLQNNSLRTAKSAGTRTKAYLAANMLVERIRSMPAHANSFVMTTAATATSLLPNAACGSTTAPCTSAAASATAQLRHWQDNLLDMIPDASMIVCRTTVINSGTPAAPDCNGTGSIVIKIWFADFDVDSKNISSAASGNNLIAVTTPY